MDSLQTIQYLERSKTYRAEDSQATVFERPNFIVALRGPNVVNENERACLECRVIPVGDPNMTFTWYKNGKELVSSSRIATSNDFGYVFLEIASAEQEDSGIYTIKVTNNYGDSVSSHTLKVNTFANIDRGSAHPESYKKIKMLEMRKIQKPVRQDLEYNGPKFVEQLNNANLTENENILLEAAVIPTDDENLEINWYKNGQSLVLGSRITTYFEFGRVALSISGAKPLDSGIYMCKAVNKSGEATSTCTIKVIESGNIDSTSMFPDTLCTLQSFEITSKGVQREETREPPTVIPYFTRHIQNVELYEGENAIFECVIEPSHDPSLNISVLHNGNEVKAGNRILITKEFNYVRIVVNCVKPNDAGIYSVKASNSAGETVSTASMKVFHVKSVEYSTLHPSGPEGLKAIHQLEGSKVAQKPIEREQVQYKSPKFTKPLFAKYNANEGDEIVLECQLESYDDPFLHIEWYFNGTQLTSSSRITHEFSLGHVQMVIKDLLNKDSGVYKCW